MTHERENLAPRYDYLLFVGPGRSATTYIYRALRSHYAVSFPDIKEAHYYRAPRRYRNARRRVPASCLLGDVANDAYMDAGLADAIRSLLLAGQKVLLVVTLRDHVERARSMLQFDESRGRALRPGGRRALERRVVERRLTPEHLRRLYSLGTDVAVLDFDALKADPTEALNRLASRCGIAPSERRLPRTGSNAAERARVIPFTAMAVLLARALRALGLRSLLQRLKDSRRIHGWFFKPLADEIDHSGGPELSAEHEDVLRRANADCWDIVRQALHISQVFHQEPDPKGRLPHQVRGVECKAQSESSSG